MQHRARSLLPFLALFATWACGTPQDPNALVGASCAPACGVGQECREGSCQALGSAGTPGTGTTTGTAVAGSGATGLGGMGSATGNAAGSGAVPNSGGASPATGNANAGSNATSAGAAPVGTGGASGEASTTTAGSTATAGAGPSTGGTSSAGTGSAGTSGESVWHGAVATAVTEELLSGEYEAWKAAHVESCPDGTSSVDKGGGSVVSEGIGYGMLLAAGFDDRPLFDGLWAFYQAHVDTNGLMNWSMDVCAAAGNNMAFAATDADLDAAMALVQAGTAWPDGTYLADAEALAAKVLEFETDDCDGRLVVRPGDNWGGCSGTENRINPSYFAPGYYRAFAAHFPMQAESWNALVEGSYALYPGYASATSEGPYPDWSNADGSSDGSGYNYDAARVPWRIATDYAWSGDARAVTELERIAAFIDDKGGIPVSGKDNNSAFSGAFALAGITDAAKLDAYVAAWLAAGGDDNPYFQGTLRVLYLLVAGGRFPSTL